LEHLRTSASTVSAAAFTAPRTYTDTHTAEHPDPKAEGVCAEPLHPVVVCRVVFDALGAQRPYPAVSPCDAGCFAALLARDAVTHVKLLST
jgi:hypothetical protein